ncbi:MAG: hypothetical protein Q3976_04400 [Corynebacterium sp.]|nr:hypothetical protein [Corynebacterium sp.]
MFPESKTLVACSVAISLFTIAACSTGDDTVNGPETESSSVQSNEVHGEQGLAYADDLENDLDILEPQDGDKIYYSLDRRALDSDVAIAILNDDGSAYYSNGAYDEFPALSLIKLLLGYWVVENTTGYEEDVAYMLEYSDDASADSFDGMYPEAISEVITQFDLDDTAYNGYWGNATTTAADLVSFLSQVFVQDPSNPIITAMAEVAPVARDGYHQDFGTAELNGVLGTKFGWSDDLSAHASLSYGSGFIIAALGYTTPTELTQVVEDSLVATSTSGHTCKGNVCVP